MNSFNDWNSVMQASVFEVWFRFVNLIPNILVALLILIVGILLAKALGRIVTELIRKLYVDKAVSATGLKKVLEKIGFKLEVSKALGLLVKWFLYAVVLVVTADILGLKQISEFLQSIVLYIPNVIIAVIILLVGTVVSNFIHTLVKETSLAGKLSGADFLANTAKWSILIFTFLAALLQLKVATELIQILFTGLVLMLALAGGIAFGLGGKDKAKEIIDGLSKK
ncbi:MAG: hypothetical protein WC768_02865 [Patescibacteria group bacterium]|jgi:hypothetical protein